MQCVLHPSTGKRSFCVNCPLQRKLSSTSPLRNCARAAAWAAAANFGFVTMAILGPVFQLICKHFNFNIMHVFHTIKFHRNVATCRCIFSILHIVLVAVHADLSRCAVCSPLMIISGGFIVFGVGGAWMSGYLGRRKNWTSTSTLHFPFACVGLVGLFSHIFKPTVFPLATYFVLSIFCTCLTIYTLFFFFSLIQPLPVNKSGTVWQCGSNKFAFIVVDYHNSSSIPPGSYFLIYSPQDSNLSYFHAHSFPVFSSRNRRVAFLVHTRISKSSNHISFTEQLSQIKPTTLRLQGPFQGAVSSFFNYLSCTNAPADIYLCGWDSGLSNVFSILEHFKDNSHLYKIRSINCLFNAITDQAVTHHTHSYMNNLVREWQNLTTTVTIIEAEYCNLDYIQCMAERLPFANKTAAMSNWRTLFPNRACWLIMKDLQNFDYYTPSPVKRCNTTYSHKVLYFCGSDFQTDKFPFGEWRSFVEAVN